eukprot:TRINITY_DN17333_c0_g1_i1.p1 TRINITY_DN17333_c0_g1~~TRINITY_DN17333_c0_g1_i1.p1  ORF type:complete len:150 (-),score=50.29 TRINITY_DN17333_c0_g1_i1:77-526(-)
MRVSLGSLLIVSALFVACAYAKTFCGNYTECSECIKHSDCVYCHGEKNSTYLCQEGDWYGPDSTKHCKHWRWEQCGLDGMWVVVIGVSGLALLLFTIMCVAFWVCCCCCKEHKKKLKYKKLINDDEPRHPSTDKRRNEMRNKWGDSISN